VLLTYRRDNVPMRIVGLNAGPADTQIFQQLLPPGTAIVNAPTLEQAPPHQLTPFPCRLAEQRHVEASHAPRQPLAFRSRRDLGRRIPPRASAVPVERGPAAPPRQ